MTAAARRTDRGRRGATLGGLAPFPWVMLRTLLSFTLVAALVLAVCSSAVAAPPSGFTAPATLGANLQVSGVVAAAEAAGGQGAAVAFADRSGGVWAARVRADGSLGAPLPAAAKQLDLRDLSVVVTDRGELVVVWAALVDRSGRSAVRYAVAEPGRSFSGVRTIATVGSNTGATPRVGARRERAPRPAAARSPSSSATPARRRPAVCFATRGVPRTGRSGRPARSATTASSRRSRRRPGAARCWPGHRARRPGAR